ncbi:MAG: Hsp20/alpha crystallin family protein [Actinobacteria bacterium]|nr:Hsp20/alpha crystallin family protein [Actinomycetota bacterium]
MAIVRWDPFDALLGAQEDMNRMFRRGWLRGPGGELAEAGAWSPAVDIYETEDSLVVEAELPGVDPKDIDVSVDEGVLSLKGERKLEKVVKEENYHRVERAYGLFQRSVRLPSDVDADAIKANYDSGVLKVSVPKVEPRKTNSVPIEVETRKEAGKEKE